MRNITFTTYLLTAAVMLRRFHVSLAALISLQVWHVSYYLLCVFLWLPTHCESQGKAVGVYPEAYIKQSHSQMLLLSGSW